MEKNISEEDVFDEDIDDIYSEKIRELLLDEDELSPEEEAFMKGYEDAG